MLNKSRILRDLIAERSHPVLVSGSHDAVSAVLSEQAGFNAIWASGFGISLAQHAVPDANIMTMSENLEFARNMNSAVSIPVIADCDNGFGNAINVIRTVREYEKAGISGICIEDNIFPKRNSFYEDINRSLETIEEFTGKIKAAKDAQEHDEFVLIARVEALIAGLGIEEALKRAHAYAAAGADAILIHSKQQTFDQLEMFASYWDHSVPLVVVPTMFPQTPTELMHKMGFQIIIYANQAVRAAVKAMRETLGMIVESGHAQAVQEIITPMSEMFDLVKLNELRDMENKYINQQKEMQFK
ncbi:hypothetical protein AMQ84_04650 [Paenibacillus riograndensis]|uniref:Phosphoenolpyruvate phosphomutase n=1 Tax=Paenibacillus riograndensis TaxID=483937 RepID=A0A132U9C7_9BACL|nr:isocitrate lyase/phosphoenolpyruvate mutase family protein [Paenibacillus riograndensis]KWX80172.1 hypothetical protein AMQ84_04650 [Paenibacillus riograndensis]